MILRPSTNGVGMLQVSFGRRKHQPRTRWRAASGSTRQRHLGSETLRRQCQSGSEGCCHRFCHTAAESKLASPQPAIQVWAKGTWAASCSRALERWERGASAQLGRAELALGGLILLSSNPIYIKHGNVALIKVAMLYRKIAWR